ncbi:APC family permease [Spirochaeta cellobiosiphila]|uniref:APC family permease n=1 Tax=Spirochaeta cellobiosiphila TaxID=504483 RepID=UPI000411585A|nr:APC family permease [Spirochaeta cellobiosiphila]
MPNLKRTLGFWSCLSVSMGLVVASSTLVTLGQGMGIAGAGFIFAMIAAWLLQHFSAQSFGELSCMMPYAGGLGSYTKVALGTLVAMVATIAGYVIPNIFAAPAELTIAGSVLSATFAPSVNPLVFGGLLFGLFIVFNLLGVDVFAKTQILFTTIMMVSITVLGLIGLTGIANDPIQTLSGLESFNPMGWGVFGLTALAIWLYIGIEFVTPMAQEVKNPEKHIPKAMTVGLLIIFIVNLLYGFASLKYVSPGILAESISPHILVAEAILGKPGLFIMSIVAVFASASTVNTIVAVVPRMLYGMAADRELPAIFGKLHPRFRTPWAGIFGMSALIGAFFFAGIANASNITIYLMAAVSSWLLAYIVAHIDVIVLRYRYPNAKRPYKAPFYPIPQVLGIVGMVFAFLNIFPDPEMAKTIFLYSGVFLVASVIYSVLWIKLKMKEKLFKTITLEDALKEWGEQSETAEVGAV